MIVHSTKLLAVRDKISSSCLYKRAWVNTSHSQKSSHTTNGEPSRKQHYKRHWHIPRSISEFMAAFNSAPFVVPWTFCCYWHFHFRVSLYIFLICCRIISNLHIFYFPSYVLRSRGCKTVQLFLETDPFNTEHIAYRIPVPCAFDL